MKILPDASAHPPATAVSPQQIADAAAAIAQMKSSGATAAEIEAAEANYRAMCEGQVDQLRQIHLQRQIQALLR